MPDYIYGDCVYLDNNIDSPKKHHNQFILNQEPDIYIKSLSSFMDEKLTLLPKIFVNRMVKN